jgi:hypothetical protein
MKKQEEEFRDIPGFEGYQVSNLGRVKSFKRYREGVLKNSIQHNGYYTTALSINNKSFTKNIHQLVAMAFLDHKPDGFKIVVDHINRDKLDNNLENLQLISNRENSSKDKRDGTSKYTGVSLIKSYSKWKAQIDVNGKSIHLGTFNTEEEASEYYQNALKAIENYEEIVCKKLNPSSKYKGVSWYNQSNKWKAQIWMNGISKTIGYFNTELEAHNAYQNKLSEISNKLN